MSLNKQTKVNLRHIYKGIDWLQQWLRHDAYIIKKYLAGFKVNWALENSY